MNQINLKLSPVPAGNNLNVSVSANNSPLIRLELYDSFGQKVKEIFNGNISNAEQNFSVDLSNLSDGTYFIKAINGKN